MKRYVGLVLAAGLAGCGDSRPHAELSPYSFNRPATTSTQAPAMTRAPQLVRAIEAPGAPAATPASGVSTTPPDQGATDTGPATRADIGASSGTYQTLGGAVAEVNGVPIYANKVLRLLRSELAARAMDLDAAQFRTFARAEIIRKIQGLERDELVFGAAERSLGDDDKRLAEYIAAQWRSRQITEAGGSPEIAQRKAAADGWNFDHLVYDQYRRFMTEVYYRKKITPRIQITADDLRAYYTAHRDEFTERAEVTFRLIKVDHRKHGGRDAALAKAKEIAAEAKQDFAAAAKSRNDDPRLAKADGLEIPIQKGSYSLEKVEAALWEAPLNEVVGPVENGAAWYIARVEGRTEAKVQAFEDRAVQDRIYKTLWGQQFRILTDGVEKKLRENAMVRDSRAMYETAIDMAMQNYARWSKGELEME
jgi:parvulin-like peptidyl-prolyl isomerase